MIQNNNASLICKVHALLIWFDPHGLRGTAQLSVMSQRVLHLFDTYAAMLHANDLAPPAQQTWF